MDFPEHGLPQISQLDYSISICYNSLVLHSSSSLFLHLFPILMKAFLQDISCSILLFILFTLITAITVREISSKTLVKCSKQSVILVGDSHIQGIGLANTITQPGNASLLQYTIARNLPSTNSKTAVILSIWPGSVSSEIEDKILSNTNPKWSKKSLSTIFTTTAYSEIISTPAIRENIATLLFQFTPLKISENTCKTSDGLPESYLPEYSNASTDWHLHNTSFIRGISEMTQHALIDKGYVPIWLETPLHPEYKDLLSEESWGEFDEWIHKLESSGGYRFNFRDLSNNRKHFWNADHFNCTLASILTDSISQRLTDIDPNYALQQP